MLCECRSSKCFVVEASEQDLIWGAIGVTDLS